MALIHKNFPIESEHLRNFDIYPKVFAENRNTTVTVKQLGGRHYMEQGREYKIHINDVWNGNPRKYPASGRFYDLPVGVIEKCGEVKFDFAFPHEGDYTVVLEIICNGRSEWFWFPVYCVAEDLCGRYPFIGDLHMHTCMSDGGQQPEEVCAIYHRTGYDFMVVSDHERYYPSLRAIDFYKDVKTELTIVPGEEVHPLSVGDFEPSVHVVNFGSNYSVNALVESTQHREVGDDPKVRSTDGKCPPVMTHAEYEKMILERAKTVKVPENVDPVNAAIYGWVFEQIRAGGGLGIFAHPNWMCDDAFNVADQMCDYFAENHVFDAFEVLGGERNYEQNGFQTARYYNDMAKGIKYPIVGSTDSHYCYEDGDCADICSTIVFSPENKTEALIDSIKSMYSVAVDTISKEFRLVGEMRFIRYGCFLLKNYFPLHDELCYESGRLMHLYYVGDEAEKAEAKELLDRMYGRLDRMRKKYFAF